MMWDAQLCNYVPVRSDPQVGPRPVAVPYDPDAFSVHAATNVVSTPTIATTPPADVFVPPADDPFLSGLWGSDTGRGGSGLDLALAGSGDIAAGHIVEERRRNGNGVPGWLVVVFAVLAGVAVGR